MTENFYLDNPDLRFHMEEMVDWNQIIELKEDIGSEECPYESIQEAFESYVDMLKDPISSFNSII